MNAATEPSRSAPPESPSSPRSPGRPRNETTRALILAATMRLLRKQTVQAITMEAIAREAGAGKTTIYRWWPSKALVVIDAFMERHVVNTPLRADLAPGDAIAHHMLSLVEQYSGWSGRIVAQLIAEGQADPAVMREFRERFYYGRRALVREVLERWRHTGGLEPSVNLDLLADALYAPVYLRLLMGHAPLDADFVREHIGLMYGLLGVSPPVLAGNGAHAAAPPKPVRRRAAAKATARPGLSRAAG